MVAPVERVVNPCQTCGAPVSVLPSQHKRGRGRFCSKNCAGVHRAVVMNAVRRSPKDYGAKPPVMRGEANPKYVPTVERTCVACGVTFHRKPHRVDGPEFRGRYCSRACRDRYRAEHEAGPASPFWVGGSKTYRGRDWQRVRMVVVREQSGCCAHCGKFVGDSLPVNHTRPFRDFATAEEANARGTLEGLCQPCHMRAEPRRRRHAASPSPESKSS